MYEVLVHPWLISTSRLHRRRCCSIQIYAVIISQFPGSGNFLAVVESVFANRSVLSAAAQSWVGGAGRRRDDVGTNPSPLVLPPLESTSDPRQLGSRAALERQSVVWQQRIQRPTTHSYARWYCFVQHESTPCQVHDPALSSMPLLSLFSSSICTGTFDFMESLSPYNRIKSFQRYGTSHSVPSVSSLISSPLFMSDSS